MIASWSLAQASVRGTPATPERASIVVDGLKLEGATAGQVLFDSRRAEFHARMQYGSWPHNPAIDLAVKLAAAAAPTIHPMMAQPLDADIMAVLHGMRDFVGKPLPARLREWQQAGGKLEIQSARLAQAESLAHANGTLALTQGGRLDGALQLTVAGIERFLPAIGGRAGLLAQPQPRRARAQRDRPRGAGARATRAAAEAADPAGRIARAARAARRARGQARHLGAGPLQRRRRQVRADSARASAAGLLNPDSISCLTRSSSEAGTTV